MSVQVYIYIYVCTCIHVHAYVCLCICVYVRMYICVYVYMHIRTYVHMYICIYVYVCMYIIAMAYMCICKLYAYGVLQYRRLIKFDRLHASGVMRTETTTQGFPTSVPTVSDMQELAALLGKATSCNRTQIGATLHHHVLTSSFRLPML